MSNISTHFFEQGQAILAGFANLVAPSTGGTIDHRGQSGVQVTLGAGTYKIANATAKGQTIRIFATGAVVLQNQDATTIGAVSSGTSATVLSTSTTAWSLSSATTGGSLIEAPINDFVTSAGVQLTTFVDNTSASAVGISALTNGPLAIRWNNNNNSTAISTVVAIPASGFNSIATVHILASKTGATSADAATFGITAVPIGTGAAYDAVATIGGTTSAMSGTATAKTVQHVTLALSDVASTSLTAPGALGLTIQPTVSTINTDDLLLHRVYITYGA